MTKIGQLVITLVTRVQPRDLPSLSMPILVTQQVKICMCAYSILIAINFMIEMQMMTTEIESVAFWSWRAADF